MLKPGPIMGLELILDSKISYVAMARYSQYRGRVDPHMLSLVQVEVESKSIRNIDIEKWMKLVSYIAGKDWEGSGLGVITLGL